MSTQEADPSGTGKKPLPFTAKVNKIPFDAPIEWLRKGAADIRRAPTVSLTYGLALTLLSILVAYISWRFGTLALYLSMASGFMLIGPVLAIGLYSVSRQIETGKTPELGYCFKQGGRYIKDMLVYSFVLLIIFMLWARSATALHIFFPAMGDYEIKDLALFLGIGTTIGAVFSAIVFTTSAFALPMIMDRKTDGITAVITSVNAVLQNKKTMFLWGLIIVALVAVGFLTAFVGFIVIMPLIGHATWHAYRSTVDANQWPENPK